MKTHDYLNLFIFSLAIILGVGIFQNAPGYMDAEYYFSGGRQLAEGYGFSENFLWNYLDDPEGLPHPSHGYWMPLASILAAIGLVIFNSTTFTSGRILFILLAGVIPVLTAYLSFQIEQQRRHALFAGILAMLSCFYLSYLGTTDTFGLTMILGGMFFIGMNIHSGEWQTNRSRLLFFFLGLLTGLMHLSRVDGIFWIVITWCFIILSYSPINRKRMVMLVGPILVSTLGYLAIMGPWMVRNLSAFGTLLSPGGMKALWITQYDELYCFPSSILNFDHWLSSGIIEILRVRLWAAWMNIQTALVVEGEIFLVPLMIWGLWKKRDTVLVKMFGISWLVIFLAMTIIFPFQGARGGFFHSSAAFQPLLWAIVPVGLDEFIKWGTRVRKWNFIQAKKFFQVGTIVLVCFISIAMVSKRVVGNNVKSPDWNRGYSYYQQLEKQLMQNGARTGEVVAVNNPPGYFLASYRPSVAIPDGNIDTLMQVADKYDVQYFLLEANHPQGLSNLYLNPGDREGIIYLFSYEGAHVFLVDKP